MHMCWTSLVEVVNITPSCLTQWGLLPLYLWFSEGMPNDPGLKFTPGSRPERPFTFRPWHTRVLWNWNLVWDSIKPTCCSQQIWFGESSAFQISSDTQGKAGRRTSAVRKMKMEEDISQKLADENKVFWIMPADCRLLSFHEYCIL